MSEIERARSVAGAADLTLRIESEEVAGGTRLRFELHSGTGRVPYTRHRLQGDLILGPGKLETYFESRLLLFHGLDGREHVAKATPGRFERELAGLGRELYREVFPEALQRAYEEVRDKITTLQIVSDEPWIPWELVKPYGETFDDDFLCCQFELVRWLAGRTTPASDLGADEIGLSRLGVIETGSVAGAPALLRAEGERRFFTELAGRHGGVEAKILASARFEEVEELLSRGGCGVLHFVGHGSFEGEDPNASLFQLAEGRHLRPRDLYGLIENRLRRDRPLVFFNSCAGSRLALGLTRLGGWVPLFLQTCGCGAFLGPMWEVRDSLAVLFATGFYNALEAGATVARAARQARLALREKYPSSTAWLAYQVYAHPGAHLRLGLGPSPLSIPEARWRPDFSPPGALLRAEYGVVPFHGREEELVGLTDWCGDGSLAAVRLYTGAGGMGKTRLSLELCQRLRNAGWETGLYSDEPGAELSAARHLQALLAKDKPVLAVVDYAERRRDLLIPLVRVMDRLERGKVRLILLARGSYGWWDALQTEGDGVGDFLSGPASRWWTLQPLANGLAERRASYLAALSAFAGHLHKPLPEEEPPDLSAGFYQRVLYLHMQALAALEDKPLRERDDLLDYILRREQRFWQKLAAERAIPAILVEGIGRAMAVFNSWAGARDEEHAIAVLDRLRLFQDQPRAVKVQVARLLRDTYPGDRWIEPMLPDLLGEHHTRREMQKDPGELLDFIGPA